ncbi:MAG TPA: GNAT family N-acetyltransferase, partial [Beijerinckiaceae bacterium]|nr:GNAT family N-acetyltransferase [Beijerinckiaceae bacterium]
MTDTLDFERISAPSRAAGPVSPVAGSVGERGLDRVEVHTDPRNALSAWAELEAVAPASLYQTRRWLLPWIATAGRSAGVEPMLVVAYSEGQPVVFCPFGISRHGGLRVAGFLGGKDSNTNLALFRPGHGYRRAELFSLLTMAAAEAPQRPDLFILSNQPGSWEDIANPLVESFPHQPSPSDCHRTDLVPQFDVFLKNRLSKDTRKKLRQKEKRLSEIGPLTHLQARAPDEIERILDAFVAQKRERLAEMGVAAAFDVPAARAFLERAAHGDFAQREAAIEFHAFAV